MKAIRDGVKAIWQEAGWGDWAIFILTTLVVIAVLGKKEIKQYSDRLGPPVSGWVDAMSDYSMAWALAPLLIFVLYTTGKHIRRLNARLADRDSEREVAFNRLAEEHNRFIDLVLNKDPPDEQIDQWIREYVEWRENAITPLVEKAVGSARAKTINRFGGRLLMHIWNPNRSGKFNHAKSMLVQTLNEIEFIVRERK